MERLLIEGNAPDPWSKLRRSYTGPSFFFHLLLLTAFLLPYIGKAIVLTGISEGMILVNEKLKDVPENLHQLKDQWNAIEKETALWTLLGYGNNKPETFAFFLVTLMMIAYNIIRLILTREVNFLRDAEERSKITPGREEYMGQTDRSMRQTDQSFDSRSFWLGAWHALKTWIICINSWRKDNKISTLWQIVLSLVGIAIIVSTILVIFLPSNFYIGLFCFFGMAGIFAWIFGLVKRDDLLPPSLIKYLGLYRLHQIASTFMYIGYFALGLQIFRWLWVTQIPTY